MILDVNHFDDAIHYLEREKERREEVLWRTKDNKLINIKDMSDSHLENTLNFLYKYKDAWEIAAMGID